MAVCAYYDIVERSLNFIENTGGWTNGQQETNQEGVVIKIYFTGFDTRIYQVDSMVPWSEYADEILAVNFMVEVIPISTQYWFADFAICSNINKLYLLDTSNVVSMKEMFRNCYGLASLDLSSFDTSNVTDMFGMFLYCESLKYIRISDLWTTANVTDSRNMFVGCIALSNFDSSYVDKTCAVYGIVSSRGEYGYLVNEACAYYDSSDNSLNFVGNDHGYTNNQIVGTKTYYTGFETDNYHVEPNSPIAGTNRPWWYSVRNNITIVNFYISVIPISTSEWFGGLNYLSNINNLYLLNTSNVTDMYSMFEGCALLTSLDLSNFNTSNVTDMSKMFATCYGLVSLDLSNFNTSNVTTMQQMFYYCRNLISLDLSNFNTSNVINMNFMFFLCASLTYLNISSFNTSKVTSMGTMFRECSSLVSLDLSNFNTSNVTTMAYMFYKCTSLTSLNVSSFNTSNVTSMTYMFSECSSLTSLNLSNFNTANVSDMSYMFFRCKANIPIFYVFNFLATENVYYMFKSTGTIYLARHPSVLDPDNNIRNFWRNIAANHPNVHFEYDDAPRPTTSIEIDRGIYNNNQWVPDEGGEVIKLTLNSHTYNTNVPSVLPINELAQVTAIINEAIEGEDYTLDNASYIIRDDTIYFTLITHPNNQYTITITLTDLSGLPTSQTIVAPGAFAMVEFRKGGHGMSIGKISERDGLDISIPTAIGEGLLLPINQQGETDLTKQQLVVGKYNQRNPDASFIVGNGTDEVHRSNALEVYNNGAVFFDNNAGQGILAVVIDILYPIGCYFETSNPDFDPNIEFGGMWSSETITDIHIVEEAYHTTNDWSYRKWSDGTAECWKKISLSSASFTASGNVYYRTASGYSFPSNFFNEVPDTVIINSDMGNVGAGSATNVSKTSFAMSIISAVATARTIVVGVYAVGTWKSYSAPSTIYRWHRIA